MLAPECPRARRLPRKAGRKASIPATSVISEAVTNTDSLFLIFQGGSLGWGGKGSRPGSATLCDCGQLLNLSELPEPPLSVIEGE